MQGHEWVYTAFPTTPVEICKICKVTREQYEDIKSKLGAVVKVCPGYDIYTGVTGVQMTGVQMFTSGSTAYGPTGVAALTGVSNDSPYFPAAKTARLAEMEREIELLRRKVLEQESWKDKPTHEPGFRKIEFDE